MTQFSKNLVRNPQYPQNTPLIDTLLIKVSTQNFLGIFLRVKQDHLWHQGWPCPSSLWSGNLNVLQVFPWSTPFLRHFWLRYPKVIHHFQNDPVFWVYGQDSSMSSKYPILECTLLDTIPVNISTWKFQGDFFGNYQDNPWSISLLGQKST